MAKKSINFALLLETYSDGHIYKDNFEFGITEGVGYCPLTVLLCRVCFSVGKKGSYATFLMSDAMIPYTGQVEVKYIYTVIDFNVKPGSRGELKSITMVDTGVKLSLITVGIMRVKSEQFEESVRQSSHMSDVCFPSSPAATGSPPPDTKALLPERFPSLCTPSTLKCRNLPHFCFTSIRSSFCHYRSMHISLFYVFSREVAYTKLT